ncbi:phospholipase A [Cupriavidus sp. HPC(L)]|uniref:phospholipase A n=1 Tax=Cupriavidus sp. HPC(L) TaxID=1217418 RepID=UPI0005B8D99F|nr:phospholipase A [Cupriavidus sp. HPC(L)]
MPLLRTPSAGRRPRLLAPAAAVSAISVALAALYAPSADAAIALLQPPRVLDGAQPLRLTLLVTADTANRGYLVPDTLEVVASPEMLAPVRITMRRITPGPSTVRLRRGENRTIQYQGEIPPTLRGQIRLDPVGLDAAPVLVTLNQSGLTPPATAATPSTSAAPATAAATPADEGDQHADVAATPVEPVLQPKGPGQPVYDQPILTGGSRLTFNDPMYYAVGAHGGANAKFQFSFKYRIFEGRAPNSRYWLDNLYLGYTQFSLWDLSEESKPFHDTNYRPSIFYYLSDTGVRNRWISRLSVATGLEHESNGRDGDQSRSINTLFLKPTFHFGEPDDWHWTVTPKLYYYLEKSDNSDIARYRGYMDLRVAYGKPDSWELAATVRKGTRQWYGSVDAQFTYPMGRLIPGTAGYLMAGYFVGYGESLLDYNRKTPWQFRIGYSLNR